VRRSEKAKQNALDLDAVTPALLERAGYRCEMCRVLPVDHRHHRLRRSQGGTNDLENLLALCHECHELVHRYPEVAYAMGWMISSKEC
jgi:hypothetical protein